MKYSKQQLWLRFQSYYTDFPKIRLALDLSRMHFGDGLFDSLKPRLQTAFEEMAQLEKGAVANADEKRMVGHYWLRNPDIAPTSEIREEIETTIKAITTFAHRVHVGQVHGQKSAFKNVLVIGIGGSALGPQFVANALGRTDTDKMTVYFFDNTDPDGIDNVLSQIGNALRRTLTIVVSKSGGTKETRNGMLEAEAAYDKAGLRFGQHAVAITSQGSQLDQYAVKNEWLARFPMWDWVGGRTSELSAVGLLPAALQGLDITNLLAGAKACDELTRLPDLKKNPAAQLAAMWYHAGGGKGSKNLIILPYKDRLQLFSKYLQQLIMESIGKQLDRDGKTVHQGITVLGNKGSTDQHSYIQQLRDGLSNFFVTFIEVLRDREAASIQVDPNITTGDYLQGFYLGTRQALFESGRDSITITVDKVSPFTVGVLIALFERTVGLYASMINVNAYHQPGVEAGKKAATAVLEVQTNVIKFLASKARKSFTSTEIAAAIGTPDEVETVFKICEHLAANPDRKVKKIAGGSPFDAKYWKL